ncbi:MAG: hypothetical protein ACYS4W_06540 [Planctomycetota bacterium]
MKNLPIDTGRRISNTLAVLLSVLALAAGCANETGQSAPEEQIKTLTEQNTQLARQLQQSQSQNQQLEKQIQVLSGLPDERSPETLYSLQRIKITRYTNLYDKDKDGKKEKLIVYIQPIDRHGDIIKAAGAVDVQLWNLDKEGPDAMLAQWHVKPDQLKKLWFATIITINYRLTFDVAEEIARTKDPLTVKVTFTDYLSGRVFKEQKVIKLL